MSRSETPNQIARRLLKRYLHEKWSPSGYAWSSTETMLEDAIVRELRKARRPAKRRPPRPRE